MKIKKSIITTVAALSLATFILPSPRIVSAAEPVIPSTSAVVSSNPTVSPLADDIRWVYYTAEDGKTYKCLYNFSTREWIGEWIYVGG